VILIRQPPHVGSPTIFFVVGVETAAGVEVADVLAGFVLTPFLASAFAAILCPFIIKLLLVFANNNEDRSEGFRLPLTLLATKFGVHNCCQQNDGCS